MFPAGENRGQILERVAEMVIPSTRVRLVAVPEGVHPSAATFISLWNDALSTASSTPAVGLPTAPRMSGDGLPTGEGTAFVEVPEKEIAAAPAAAIAGFDMVYVPDGLQRER